MLLSRAMVDERLIGSFTGLVRARMNTVHQHLQDTSWMLETFKSWFVNHITISFSTNPGEGRNLLPGRESIVRGHPKSKELNLGYSTHDRTA